MIDSNTQDLCDKGKLIHTYDECYSQGYMDDCWSEEVKRRIYEIIRGLNLAECGDVLDFGCGSGALTDVIKRALPGWKVYGTDISSVAVEKARQHNPDCNFFVTDTQDVADKKFDFVFTNHVFEHVYDVNCVLDGMLEYLKPSAAMLHILPCGNEGSWERGICLLHKNGINPGRGNRFFFEDERHVRRLNTDDFARLLADRGFVLKEQYYKNQHYGAIDWITEGGLHWVELLTNVSTAINGNAERKLCGLKSYLRSISILRAFTAKLETRWSKEKKTAKDFARLVFWLPLYLVAKPVDIYYRMQSRREWRTRRSERNGSEMFLYFGRG